MGLQITITHLTRMRGDRICVAGLTDNAAFVRPDCDGYLHRSDVPDLFDIGSRIDLGPVSRMPAPPQVENVTFNRSRAKRLGQVDEAALRELLRSSARETVDAVLGDALKRTHAGTCYVEPGSGSASLGTLALSPGALDLRPDSYDRLCGWWDDPRQGPLRLPVTDLRLFPVGQGHDPPAVEALRAESVECDELFLSIGLTKSWARRPGHWLQLNNVLPVRSLRAITLAVASHDWPQHSRETLASLKQHYPAVMERYPRAWAPWNEAEDEALIEAVEGGATTKALAERHQRKPGAIRSRLKKLGLLG